MPTHKRRKAPPIQRIAPLPFPDVQHCTLRNGIPVYMLPHPKHEALKFEWVYRAGRPEEIKPLVARATARLLREGASRYSGAELAEQLDFYGSSLQTPVNLDTANLVLYSLRKYAEATLPFVADMLLKPSFPENELHLFKENSIRELAVELEKGDVVAYRVLTEMLFGSTHPYGYNSTPELYRALVRDDLVHHHARWHTPARSAVFLSGGINDQLLQRIEDLFGDTSPDAPEAHTVAPAPVYPPETRRIPQPGSLQTAIKVGRRLFNRHHEDFNGLFVLNTLLGGYFGSRLSMNIRENHGFTYNIYSSVDAMLHDGFLYIATEVDHRNTEATLREIYAEMTRLQQESVPDHELEMVRNYLLGMLLNGIDGPLNTSDLLRSYVVDGLPTNAYNVLTDTIKHITAPDLQALAQQYLNPADYSVVLVGGK
jgi:predicted Zn-dependent peptidase